MSSRPPPSPAGATTSRSGFRDGRRDTRSPRSLVPPEPAPAPTIPTPSTKDIMTTVNGLPAHILLVHAIVVLLPLTALLLVLSALWPAARRKVAGPNAILSVLVVVLVPITTEAGEWLERRRLDAARAHPHGARRHCRLRRDPGSRARPRLLVAPPRKPAGPDVRHAECRLDRGRHPPAHVPRPGLDRGDCGDRGPVHRGRGRRVVRRLPHRGLRRPGHLARPVQLDPGTPRLRALTAHSPGEFTSRDRA